MHVRCKAAPIVGDANLKVAVLGTESHEALTAARCRAALVRASIAMR